MEQRKDYFSTLHEEKIPKDLYLDIANYFGPNKIVVIGRQETLEGVSATQLQDV